MRRLHPDHDAIRVVVCTIRSLRTTCVRVYERSDGGYS